MSTRVPMSQKLFDEQSELAIKRQPIRKSVLLSQIKIISPQVIEYDKVRIQLTPKALLDLWSLCGIKKSLNEILGDEFVDKLLKTLKEAISYRRKDRILMVIGNDRRVIRFLSTFNTTLSNTAFLRVSNEFINKYNMEVEDFEVSPDDGSVTIQTISRLSGFNVPGLKDEDFESGITISNSISGGVRFDPYIYRLICSNGLTGAGFVESTRLNKFDNRSMKQFYDSVDEMSKNSFQPTAFVETVTRANATKASIHEMQSAINLIGNRAKNVDMDRFIDSRQTIADYKNLNIDINDFSQAQAKNAKSSLSVWDVINGITDFASHDYGYAVPEYDRIGLQAGAGKLLTKKFDSSNLVPVQPNY